MGGCWKNQFIKCPWGGSKCHNLGPVSGSGTTSGSCPRSYPYALRHGTQCCKSNKDSYGKSPIAYASAACWKNQKVKCPHGRCSNFGSSNSGSGNPAPAPAPVGPVTYKSIGCYKDTNTRAISGPIVTYDIPNKNIVKWCAQRARRLGHTCFSVQYNTMCFTSAKACSTYAKYGKVSGCRYGRGGIWLNSVYKLTGASVGHGPAQPSNPGPVSHKSLGCWGDKYGIGKRAITGATVLYPKSYATAVNQCAARAKRLGNKCFAVQNNKECYTSKKACSTYKRYGKTAGCINGRGKYGKYIQNVYQLN